MGLVVIGLWALTCGCEKHKQVPTPPGPVPAPEVRVEVKTADGRQAQLLDDSAAERLKQQAMIADAAPVSKPAPANATAEPTTVTPPTMETEPMAAEPVAREPIPPTTGSEDLTPKLVRPELADKLITVNFDQADIRVVIKTVSDITGINFIVDDKISGTVSVLSPTQIRVGDLYRFLESILEVKGFAAVPTGDVVKIVQRSEAGRRNLQVRVGNDPAGILRDDTVITQIIPLDYAEASEVSQVVQTLLTAEAHLAIYPRTNALMVTDTSNSIHHLAQIIRQLDVPGARKEVSVIPLRYASAAILSKQITEILAEDQQNTRRGAATATPALPGAPKILPDARTNALVAVANAQDTQTIRKIAQRLDVEQPRGATNAHVVYLENAPAKEVATALTAALTNMGVKGETNQTTERPQITPEEGTNSLIITATGEDFRLIGELIAQLDVVREQVLVEMLIVEISESALLEIGFDWQTLTQAVSDNIRGFGGTNYGVRVDQANGDLEGLSVGAFKKIGGNTQVAAILHALQKTSGVNILSTPHIMTTNHQQAKIFVGQNVPFVTQGRITDTEPSKPTVIKTIEYKDVGVSLDITPHISQGGMVRLVVESEFKQIIEGVSGAAADTPTTASRKATTTVSMPGGETFVIGGLIRDDKTTLVKKIPLLGDIPLLGQLFQFKRDRTEKTNLLLFITPYILHGATDMQLASQRKKKEMPPYEKKPASDAVTFQTQVQPQ